MTSFFQLKAFFDSLCSFRSCTRRKKLAFLSAFATKLALATSLLMGIGSLRSAEANSGGGPLGLGVILGAPTGVSGKYKLSPANSIDGALAWRLGGGALIQSAYLWQQGTAFHIGKAPIDWYFGAGGRITFRDDTFLGARVPLGLRHSFRSVAIEVFGETALTLNLIPKTSADLDFAIGARYFF